MQIGAIIEAAEALTAARLRGTDGDAHDYFRRQLVWTILLGLELIVAVDIIRSVAIAPGGEIVAMRGAQHGASQ